MIKYVKKQIMELLDTLMEARETVQMVIGQHDDAGLMNVLADAQEAAVAVGNQLEEAAENGNADGDVTQETVSILEKYCELLWRVTQEEGAQERLLLVAEGWGLLEEVQRNVTRLSEQIPVVFMPYKASMWDCMESVWEAAREDPDCAPFVVPIPYYDTQEGKITATHYEGDQFPAYVRVTDYQNFPLEEIHPGAIFIHNPFDDYNKVTSVPPQFYSGELKKCTDRLIYIPYYVTGEAVYVTHRYIPPYDNMDFIVTQCENMIASYSAELPREKFLPFGSPVADRILKLENARPEIPESWKSQLKNGQDFGSDRAVMLNTSISLLMKEKDRFLDKIEYLFDVAKRSQGITLVWRPHPLLYASAQSLGEAYAARLGELERKFSQDKIGVLDKNPDVGVTVALCDAYLGETASSMIHMFGIAGKPRFYTNLMIPERKKNPGDTRYYVSAFCQTGEKEYYVLDRTGWIVEKNRDTDKVTPLVRIPGRETVRGRAYKKMEIRENCLWVYPDNARGTFIYDLKTGKMRKVYEPEEAGWKGPGEDSRKEASSGEGDVYLQEGLFFRDGPVVQEGAFFLDVGRECRAYIQAERFKRGNLNHEWNENDTNTTEDYFNFLVSAQDSELVGYQGAYPVWLASLDGSCGRKVMQAVKESIGKRRA